MERFITITLILILVIHGCSCSSSARKSDEVQEEDVIATDVECKSNVIRTYMDRQDDTYHIISGDNCILGAHDATDEISCKQSLSQTISLTSGRAIYSEDVEYSGTEGGLEQEHESKHILKLKTLVTDVLDTNNVLLDVKIREDVSPISEMSRNSSFTYEAKGLPGESACPLKAYSKAFEGLHRLPSYIVSEPKSSAILYGPIFYNKCTSSKLCTEEDSKKCEDTDCLTSVVYLILKNSDEIEYPAQIPHITPEKLSEITGKFLQGAIEDDFIIMTSSSVKQTSDGDPVQQSAEVVCKSKEIVCYKLVEYLGELYTNTFALIDALIFSTSDTSAVLHPTPVRKIISTQDHEFEILVVNIPIDVTGYDKTDQT